MDWDLFIITFLTGLSYGVILTACSVYLLVAAQKMKGVKGPQPRETRWLIVT